MEDDAFEVPERPAGAHPPDVTAVPGHAKLCVPVQTGHGGENALAFGGCEVSHTDVAVWTWFRTPGTPSVHRPYPRSRVRRHRARAAFLAVARRSSGAKAAARARAPLSTPYGKGLTGRLDHSHFKRKGVAGELEVVAP